MMKQVSKQFVKQRKKLWIKKQLNRRSNVEFFKSPLS
jgi:hypothetical protein